mgnify:CR=1 FL=1
MLVWLVASLSLLSCSFGLSLLRSLLRLQFVATPVFGWFALSTISTSHYSGLRLIQLFHDFSSSDTPAFVFHFVLLLHSSALFYGPTHSLFFHYSALPLLHYFSVLSHFSVIRLFHNSAPFHYSTLPGFRTFPLVCNFPCFHYFTVLC